MEMNFRLIVRYDMTEEVTDQYFATLGDADTVVTYLDKAMENGASRLCRTRKSRIRRHRNHR